MAQRGRPRKYTKKSAETQTTNIEPQATGATSNEQPAIIGSTFEAPRQESTSGSDLVTLAISLRGGHVFDDVPDGRGGTKSVRLAGLDDHLRGSKGGILTPAGNAVFQQIPRADWEAIKAMHGGERMFKSWQGLPPCVREIESVKAAKTGALKDELASTKTGADPLTPTAEGLSEASPE